MKVLNKYFAILLMCAIALGAILNSCKKISNTEEKLNNELAGLDAVKKNVQKQMEALGGIPERVELHKRMEIAYADMDGNIINSLPTGSNNLTSACSGDVPDYLDLDYYYKLYQCNLGYKIKFGWRLSWNNNVVLQNPFNTANRTRGTIRISTPTVANAYSNNATDVQIYDLGEDPLNPDNNIFLVEMTSTTLIPLSLINAPGATLRLGAFFASDCSTLQNYSVVPLSLTNFGYTAPLSSNPCTRNDKAWYQSPDPGSNIIHIAGYDPLGICPITAAGSTPSYQEVQYDYGTGTWKDFINWLSPFVGTLPNNPGIKNSRWVSQVDVAKSAPIPSGTYTITIRYRNIVLNTGYPFGLTRPAPGNHCANPDWTIETYPNVVIP